MTEWANRQRDADAEWRMLREQAETESCPELECLAPIGEHCKNLTSGLDLEHLPAHGKRIKRFEDRAAGLIEEAPG
jgi:hypothetical protein